MPTISLCLIAHNNANILGPCLGSVCQHVDEIVVVDSYSTDTTKEVADKYTDKVYDLDDPEAYLTDDQALYDKLNIKGKPSGLRFLGDYSKARNFSFSKATSDYIMWLDTDDVVKNPEEIPRLIQLMEKDKVNAVKINYDYSFDSNGKPLTALSRERIVRNSPDIRWVYPGHEVINVTGVTADYPTTLNIEHRNHSGGNVARKIEHKAFKILKSYILNNDLVDARIYFYLGREAVNVSLDESISAFENYLKVGWWDEEVALARATMGCIFEDLGDYNKAWNYFAGAQMSYETNPDGYFGLARIAYYKQMWDKCIHFTTLGLNTKFKGVLWTAQASYRRSNPYVFSNVAYSRLGRNKEALEACLKGLEIDPNDKNLLHNKAFYEKQLFAMRPTGGWQRQGLIDMCEKYLKQDHVLVEIGAYAGEGTVILSKYVKKVVSVDPWQNGYDSFDDASNTTEQAEAAYDERVKNLPNVQKFKGKSEDWVSAFDDESLDVVYIDGDHRYESVKKDLQIWLSKVKKGGIISGHDYGRVGVTEAVDEVIGKPLEVFNDGSWVKHKE